MKNDEFEANVATLLLKLKGIVAVYLIGLILDQPVDLILNWSDSTQWIIILFI